MSKEQRTLQLQLTITPKTALLLIRLGYRDYRDLKDASPNHIATRLQAMPGITKSMADGYRRAARRLVWLGTQDNPQEHAKVCADWSNKALKARGIWRDNFDDLTGVMIEELIAESTLSGSESPRIDSQLVSINPEAVSRKPRKATNM